MTLEQEELEREQVRTGPVGQLKTDKNTRGTVRSKRLNDGVAISTHVSGLLQYNPDTVNFTRQKA